MKKNEDITKGLLLNPNGSIVLLGNHNKGWSKMIETLDDKYNCSANYETYCTLQYMGVDAEATFLSKIKELEYNEKN
jgi:hypothetical protein